MTTPWLTIWTEPKATIRAIVAHNPNQSLWLLAFIYGFSSLLNSFQSAGAGDQTTLGIILLLTVLLAAFWGYAVFAIWSWVVLWTGKLFKGDGNFLEVRAAYAWSCVPIVLNGVLWIFMLFFFGQPLFSNVLKDYFLTSTQTTFLFAILIGKVILAVWSLVIYLNALAEVQKFSVLKAIGNVVVAAVVLGVVLGLLWMLALHFLGVDMSQTGAAFYDGQIFEYMRGVSL